LLDFEIVSNNTNRSEALKQLASGKDSFTGAFVRSGGMRSPS
jgi:hypothetical protein